MFFSSTHPSTFNPLQSAVNLQSSSPRSQFYTVSAARSRRRLTVNVSLPSVFEPVTLNFGRSMSLYEILRVDQKASPMEIKTAYRSLAKLYHPDAIHDEGESDSREFIQIHDAYETLSDPAARAVYDLSLQAASNYYRRSRSVRFSEGYYPSRRWETDQCW